LDTWHCAFRVLWSLALAVVLAACGGAIARNPLPLALEDNAQVAGMDAEVIRFWGDELPPNDSALRQKRLAQLKQSRPELRGGGRRPVMTRDLSWMDGLRDAAQL
jgi:hypothetical protein